MGALTVGAAVHGYAGGAFGRDSYACRVVEAIGPDWIVTRNRHGEAEAVTGEHVAWVAEHAEERDWCALDCDPRD